MQRDVDTDNAAVAPADKSGLVDLEVVEQSQMVGRHEVVAVRLLGARGAAMRRFTRLTNGFSKKVEAHANAVALYFMFCNFVRTHQKLRATPAMAAAVTTKLWEVSDIVALIEAKKPRSQWLAASTKSELRGNSSQRPRSL